MAWASSPCVKRLPLPIRTAKMAVPPENLDAPDEEWEWEVGVDKGKRAW
ncbi:MAG: hypothetical protein ACRC8S_10145 [Fimbriiglobus sp.]